MKKKIIIVVAFGLILSISACSSTTTSDTTVKNTEVSNSATSVSDTSSNEETSPDNNSSNDVDFKDLEYTYMTRFGSVYTAKIISDKVIKIENWRKSYTTDKELSFFKDLGAYKISDSEKQFEWIGDDHTVFSLMFKDEGSAYFEEPIQCYFTVCISNDNIMKGSDADKGIMCYSYVNDGGHMYRAIPLNDKYLKIECWTKMHIDDEEFIYNWDCGILGSDEGDFEWVDEEHSAFMVTMRDEINGYWTQPTLSLFCLESKDYKYSSVIDYISNK